MLESWLVIEEDLVKREPQLRERFLGAEVVAELTGSTPAEWRDNRTIRGGSNVDFVAGNYFIQRLNNAFGFLWSTEVSEHWEHGKQIAGRGRVTAHIPVPKKVIVREYLDKEGRQVKETETEFEILNVVKEQFGSTDIKTYADDKPMRTRDGSIIYEGEGASKHALFEHRKGDIIDIGDDYKSLATDIMKKCGTEFGLFPDIYGPKERKDEKQRAGGNKDTVTDDQLEAVYSRGLQAGMEKDQLDEWASAELKKPFGEATAVEALSLVPKLVALAKEKKKNA